MNDNLTYILLSRSILDSEVFANQKLLKIWIWCLVKANFKDRNVPLKVGKGIRTVKVKRGSFIFGRMKAEDELFIDGSTIYKAMKKLEELGNISIESNNQYSIVTLLNYDTYQNAKTYQVTANEQPMSSQVTSNEQPSNTDNTLNKENKDKQYNKETCFSFDDFWDMYSKKSDTKICKAKYANISEADRLKIKTTLPKYLDSIKDKKFLKHPKTYLHGEVWNDEIIQSDKPTTYKLKMN